MKSDNELIAEFMGWRQTIENPKQPDFWIHPEHSTKVTDRVSIPCTSDYFKRYEQSWDWLMPVVEKIEDDIGANVVIETGAVTIEGFIHFSDDIPYTHHVRPYESQEETKINLVYNAVIQFIKWYNQQKQ